MSIVREIIHNEQQALLSALSAQVGALVDRAPAAGAETLARFLEAALLPHLRSQERHLCPAVERFLAADRWAAAAMRVDYEAIEGYAREIAGILAALRMARAAERPALEDRLRRVALTLEAVVRLHVTRQERLCLPLLESHLSNETQRLVLNGLHGPLR